MCAPKVPKVKDGQQIPIRQPILMPDGGDPSLASSLRRGSGSKLRSSAMIFANRTGALGAPSVTTPLGTGNL